MVIYVLLHPFVRIGTCKKKNFPFSTLWIVADSASAILRSFSSSISSRTRPSVSASSNLAYVGNKLDFCYWIWWNWILLNFTLWKQFENDLSIGFRRNYSDKELFPITLSGKKGMKLNQTLPTLYSNFAYFVFFVRKSVY